MKRILLRYILPSGISILCGLIVLKMGLGTGETVGSFAGLLFMMGSIVLVGIINSGPIARMIANISMALIDPAEHFDGPRPAYSPARAKRKMREFDAAFLEYEKIIREHPAEIQPYIDMMEIAMVDLHSPGKLDAIYERGMNAIKDEEHRANLTRYHGVLKEWKKQPIP